MQFKRGKTISEIRKTLGLGTPQIGDVYKCITTIDYVISTSEWVPVKRIASHVAFIKDKIYPVTIINCGGDVKLKSLCGFGKTPWEVWMSHKQLSLYFKRI